METRVCPHGAPSRGRGGGRRTSELTLPLSKNGYSKTAVRIQLCMGGAVRARRALRHGYANNRWRWQREVRMEPIRTQTTVAPVAVAVATSGAAAAAATKPMDIACALPLSLVLARPTQSMGEWGGGGRSRIGLQCNAKRATSHVHQIGFLPREKA